ncbi:MAG TPA: transglutaminase-like domain-containing protein, partial [Sumerlaeia bacterium]|nr:transglutaminase-like domain-containing protein [Sumerlaeia bacterium]
MVQATRSVPDATAGRRTRPLALAAAVGALVLLAVPLRARSEAPAPPSQAPDSTKRIASDLQRVARTLEEVKSKQDLLLQAMLSEKVDKITEGAKSDQEISLAVARWISANIANTSAGTSDPYLVFATRSGLCGSRARLFVEMVERKSIPARLFNMYNFGQVGGGHSCAQAFYDGQWHFFDATYAGVFMRDGKVLSWEEIVANPESALENMVVFENTLDRSGGVDQDLVDRPRVESNTARMNSAYTLDSLRNARSAGFLGYPKVKTVYPVVTGEDLSRGALTIGKIDASRSDVTPDGVRQKISEMLG